MYYNDYISIEINFQQSQKGLTKLNIKSNYNIISCKPLFHLMNKINLNEVDV